MYVPFFRSGRSQNSYLRLCAFLRFFRDFFLPGVCKVDQQNACTSKIPIIAPQLSIPTSLTEGPRAKKLPAPSYAAPQLNDKPGWYRIAVRTRAENEALIRAVREV